MTHSPQPISPLPEQFKTRISSLFGKDGTDWLQTLPALRRSLLERWSLQNPQPLSQLSYNYLAYAHSPEHGPVVLKIGFPNPELTTEIKALAYYRGGEGAVSLLDCDPEIGALLLKRILPGDNLTVLEDDRHATRIAAEAMVALRRPRPGGSEFPTMETWCRGYSRYRENFPRHGGPLPRALFEQADRLADELLHSAGREYLLHGDLHHGNLLFQEGGAWVAIDPKGVIGEFACEAGPFLCNPIPSLIRRPALMNVLKDRLAILAEVTGLDRQRLAAWSFCRAVLSAIWSWEEGEQGPAYWVEIAGLLRRLV